jgi:hypothetical protein
MAYADGVCRWRMPMAYADGVWTDSDGSPKDCFTVMAGCSFDGSRLTLCFVAMGKTARCHHGFGGIVPTGSHTRRKGG